MIFILLSDCVVKLTLKLATKLKVLHVSIVTLSTQCVKLTAVVRLILYFP